MLDEKLKELKGLIDAKQEVVSREKAAFEAKRTELADVDVAVLANPESDQFKALDDAHRKFSGPADELAVLKGQFERLALMSADGSKSLKDDPEERETRTAMKDLFHSESIGQKAIASEAYKALKASGALNDGSQVGIGQKALTDPEAAEDHVKALKMRQAQAKALITGAGADSAGASLLVPQYLAGIDVAPQVPLNVMQLISIGQTSAASIKYRRLLSRTIRAAAVAEASSSADIGDGTGGTATALQGGRKPESDLLFEAATAEVSTFAHLIPVTRNELDDAEGLASTIDSEMRIGVDRVQETQIIQGTGTNDELLGVLNTPGIASYTQGTASGATGEPRVDAIHRLFTMLRITGYQPTGLLIHPNDWQAVRLSKDTVGNYIYGPPSQAGANQVWGVPVIESIAVSEGHPVGAEWPRAEYRVRSGIQTFVSDSHKDWFARNLLALLAEARGMLIIRRPQAFGEVNFA